MAVQAQYPSNILTEIRNKANQSFAMENRSYFVPFTFLDQDENQQGLLHSIVQPSNNGQPVSTVAFMPQSALDMSQLLGSRKRARLSLDHLSARTPLLSGNQIQQAPMVQQSTGLVSTGLRLGLDDGRNTPMPNSPRPDSSLTVLSSLCEEFSTQLKQQQEDLNQFITIQNEQLRQALEERRQIHLRGLLAAFESSVNRRLKEKEMELQNVQMKNHELEEQAKGLSIEAHLWRSKAKSNEAMVAALRSNLQLAQSREQSKEGCGDSEADDAVSANRGATIVDGQSMAASNRIGAEVLVRRCRSCKTKGVSILLLPCLHLCLCKSCEGSVDICPLCHCTKSASVEVYMS